jgi:hypothetical protein
MLNKSKRRNTLRLNSLEKLETHLLTKGENMSLKRLCLSFTLMSVLAVASFAGETGSPPCIPGETGTPPCSQSVTGGSTEPGETSAPPSDAVELNTIVEAVQLALSLF